MLERALIRTWDRAVHSAAAIGYRLPLAHPARYGVEVTRDVRYAATTRRAHLLDVYRPLGRRAAPALLYVHGGGFAVLSKDTHRIMALAFASAGFSVFNINYRMGPAHRFPAPLEDASAALDWVAAHASDFDADATRLCLAGESAGANLVAALTYCATHPRPESYARRLFDLDLQIRAVLPIYGLFDMQDMARFERAGMPWWLRAAIRQAGTSYVGRPLEERAASAPLASPLRCFQAPKPTGARPLPPFFLACGTRDPLLGDSKALCEALRQRGARCELSIHPGEIHGFNALLWRREARAKWRAAFSFLDRHTAVSQQ
ncbi:MAG: alpha/beta hydrolase [Myxococcales bacterium]|nr:alpha/beta hydrolase [Myxococcales bacterium]